MRKQMDIGRVIERVEAETQAMVELQKRITAVPAIGPDNGGEGELKRAELLKTLLQEFGYPVIEDHPCPDERVPAKHRPNVIARIPGRDKARTLWILSHMDIVPPGEREHWDTDPFVAVVKDGRIFGRGVEDNQQAMVASIAAGKVLIEEGIEPEINYALALVSDEETGSKYGLEHLIGEGVFREGDLILVPDFGSPDGDKIEIAEKSIVWFKFTVKGIQCHASKPVPGCNSLRAASDLIMRLEGLYGKFSYRDELFEPPGSTFEPTKKDANVPNVNTIPGEDVFYLDCRILPRFEVDEVAQAVSEQARKVEKARGVSIAVEMVKRDDAPDPTPADSDVVKALAKAIKRVHKRDAKFVGVGGGTVAAVFRKHGMPAAVWTQNHETAHQANESCVISHMVGDAKVFAALIMDPRP